ncbi:MAG: hypothetical protein HYS59_02255 [Candidatus Vogelbacteria bacterium]|nr:hypothetical protein [Candidatus Vogelbacteria bacterium]
MKLQEKAFAHAWAVVVAIVYVFYYLLAIAAPTGFIFLFNASFFGANVVSLLPSTMTTAEFVQVTLVSAIMAWVMGYLVAHFYNYFLGKR